MYTNNNTINCDRRIALINTFRKLWEQHVMWTRSFIVSTAANLADLQAVTQRLLRNPADFANELQKYYGVRTAERFRELFTEHLTIAAQLVNEAKAGDTAAVEISRRRWYQNADEIAEFLSRINPYWSKRLWQSMLNTHLKMTEEEAVLRLNGRPDIAIFDEIEEQALEMADMMSEGVIKQFNL